MRRSSLLGRPGPRILAACAALAGAAACTEEAREAAPPAAAGAQTSAVTIDHAELAATLRHLTTPELGGRGSWQAGGRRAGDWIASRMRAWRAPAAYDGGLLRAFTVKKDTLNTWNLVPPDEVLTRHRVCHYPAIPEATPDWEARNVVAAFPGSDPEAREAVVLSAHFDHQGEHDVAGGEHVVCYGANDNASGASVVLSVAEALARQTSRPKRTIVVALFDAEEVGRKGAGAMLADLPPALRGKQLLAVNLDQMGSLREHALYFNDDALAPSVHRLVREVMARHAPVVPHYEELGISSDDRNFHAAGAPALQITSGHYRRYHTAAERVEPIAMDGLRAIADATLDLVLTAADGAGGWRQEEPGPAVAAAVRAWERADAALHEARAEVCATLGVGEEGAIDQSGLASVLFGTDAPGAELRGWLDLFQRPNAWPFGAYDERAEALDAIEAAIDRAAAGRPTPSVAQRDLHDRFRAGAATWRERLVLVRAAQAALTSATP